MEECLNGNLVTARQHTPRGPREFGYVYVNTREELFSKSAGWATKNNKKDNPKNRLKNTWYKIITSESANLWILSV